MKKFEVLEKIYLHPGIHLREIARKTNLGLPAVRNHIDKFLKEKVIFERKEGRNLKFFINFKNRKVAVYLSEVEMLRLEKLPRVIGDALFDFLSSLGNKPIVTLVFGSYARGDYGKESDLDILLVFNRSIMKMKREIELNTKLISSRHSLRIRPVYFSWKDFREKFFDAKDIFMEEVKANKIIINGMEYWVMLENEKA